MLLTRITLPRDLGEALKDAGLNRARLYLTDEGILLEPFRGDPKSHTQRKLELPSAWMEAK